MTARYAMIVISFVAASMVSGVLLAVATWSLPMLGIVPGPWALPVAVVAGFLPVFLLVRGYVLPPPLAHPAWKAATTLTMWIGLTLALWQGAMSVMRPVLRVVGFERGTFAILLACLIAGLLVIELALRRLTR